MKPADIREKLHRYIENAHEKKLKAIYSMVEEDAANIGTWNDKAFIAEIDHRIAQLESGEIKGFTISEVKEQIDKALKSAKRKK